MPAKEIFRRMKHVAMSSGSACTSKILEPSHVLQAINVPNNCIQGSIRFGIGKQNSKEEIKDVIQEFKKVLSN